MKTKHILAGIGIVLFTSCTDYLDIKPYGRTIPKTAEEFSALMHNHLNNIDSGEDEDIVGNSSALLEWDAACGDDFETCLTETYGNILRNYVGDILGSLGCEITYQHLYETIRDCNIVLGEMEESGTEEADNVRATAYALRGVCYYQLLRIYCEPPVPGNFSAQLGVPLVMTFDMEEKPLRSSMQQTIDQIESDLENSLAYHMDEEVYRFTEDVVKGYLARLYFWTRQWSMALPIAQELLGKYPLLEGEAYETMMTTSYDLAGNQLLKAYRTVSTQGSTGLESSSTTLQYRPVSTRFLDAFIGDEKKTDIRYRLWVNTKRQSVKTIFCGMRSAEFKLMEAECYYHLGQEDKALQSINDLRRHRINNYADQKMEDLTDVLPSEIIRQDAEGNALTPLMATILREGCDRLSRGISVIVFPQSTRTLHIDPKHFNTIGVKLARKANVPVVPLALKTDAWGAGRKIKELGKIRPDNDVIFRFFPPVTVEGSGHAEHKAILEAISSTLHYWEWRQKEKDEGRQVPPLLDPDFTLPTIER